MHVQKIRTERHGKLFQLYRVKLYEFDDNEHESIDDNEDEYFGMTEQPYAQNLTVCPISAALMKFIFNKIAV